MIEIPLQEDTQPVEEGTQPSFTSKTLRQEVGAGRDLDVTASSEDTGAAPAWQDETQPPEGQDMPAFGDTTVVTDTRTHEEKFEALVAGEPPFDDEDTAYAPILDLGRPAHEEKEAFLSRVRQQVMQLRRQLDEAIVQGVPGYTITLLEENKEEERVRYRIFNAQQKETALVQLVYDQTNPHWGKMPTSNGREIIIFQPDEPQDASLQNMLKDLFPWDSM